MGNKWLNEIKITYNTKARCVDYHDNKHEVYPK